MTLKGAGTRTKIMAEFYRRETSHQLPPTFKDLMAVTGIRSTAPLWHHLQILAEFGFLDYRGKGKPFAYVLKREDQ